MSETRFSVPFVAFQPRPRMTRRPFPHLYEEQRDVREKRLIAEAFRAAGGVPVEGPACVEIRVEAPLPKGRPKAVEAEPHTVKPDADNVAKKVLDALNGVAWRDDAQVTRLLVEKLPRRRGAEAATHVTVRDGEEGV